MVKTEAIVAVEAGADWRLEQVELDDPADDELLVEMVAAGVCFTDVKTAQGKFAIKPPVILGHEGAGYIRQVGARAQHSFKEGDAVVLSYASCQSCASCKSGNNPFCQHIARCNFSGCRDDGSSVVKSTSNTTEKVKGLFFGQSSFSKVAIVNASCAVKVDVKDREELKKLVIGCGFQTGAGAIANVCQPPIQSSIAVWGCGTVGLSAIMTAKLTTPQFLIAIDMLDDKLELAKKYGATHTINGGKEDVGKRIQEISGGLGVQYALDAVGSPAILKLAQLSLGVKGTMVTIGGTPHDVVLSTLPHIQKGLTYRGCHMGDAIPSLFLPKLIDLWKHGLYPFDDLLAFYKFEDFAQALQDLKDGKVVKPVLVM